nr:hypothetical protein [Tanacetum cinerariifolium]
MKDPSLHEPSQRKSSKWSCFDETLMKARRRAKAQQAYPLSKQAPMQELPLYEVLPSLNYVPIFAFRSAVAPRSLSLRNPAHFQLGLLLARLALARNSQLTSPTQQREVVYLLSSNMPTAFRSLTQDSLVYLLASAIPHLSFQGSPRSGESPLTASPNILPLPHHGGLQEIPEARSERLLYHTF